MFNSLRSNAALLLTGTLGFAILSGGCTLTVQNDPSPPATRYFLEGVEVCPTVHETDYYLAYYDAEIRVSGYNNDAGAYIGGQPSGLSTVQTLNGNGKLVPDTLHPCVLFKLGAASGWSDNLDITDPKIDITADGRHTGGIPYGDPAIVYSAANGYYLRLYVDADLDRYTDSSGAIKSYMRKQMLKQGVKSLFGNKATAILDDGEKRDNKNAPSSSDSDKPEQAGKMKAI
ncbi:MAG: hypothetical protein HY075_10985 [Deltaproteobacteria bacterium]|nr:hypothetical protein [Deltaproteobacteria bacterium]